MYDDLGDLLETYFGDLSTLKQALEDAERGRGRAAGTPSEDRVKGMLYGVALGDALGAPHEFHYQVPLGRYTGRLEYPLKLLQRYQDAKLGVVGQVSDDTEMTAALARTIAAKGGYKQEEAVLEYLNWTATRPPFLGKNTRALLSGVTTLRGYKARKAALLAAPASTWSQSNGCLMRASPLATLPDERWREAAIEDCSITNPHPICIASVVSYVAAARILLAGGTPDEATQAALDAASEDAVKNVILAAKVGAPRDVNDPRQKGWVLHALHCAFLAISDALPLPLSYQDRIDYIIRLGGDTDTNAAIAGALLGAHLGCSSLSGGQEARTTSNLQVLLACDSSKGAIARPREYSADALGRLAGRLCSL